MPKSESETPSHWSRCKCWLGLIGLALYALFLCSLVWFEIPLWYFFASLLWLFASGLLVAWASPNFSWQIKGSKRGLLGAELGASSFSGDGGCD